MTAQMVTELPQVWREEQRKDRRDVARIVVWERRRSPQSAPRKPVQPPPASNPAAPCMECGTTGGMVPRDCNRPVRTNGLCNRCYQWYRAFRVNRGHNAPANQHPDPCPTYTIAATGAMLWEGGANHAVLPYAFDAGNLVAQCEDYAAAWLALHPEQSRPELSGAVFAFGEAA